MVTSSTYKNINLPFVFFIVCWAFKNCGTGKRICAASERRYVWGQTALETTQGANHFSAEMDSTDQYASNVDMCVVSVWVCVGGWPGLVVVVCLANCVAWCFDIVVAGQTVAGCFVLHGDLYHHWEPVLCSDATLSPSSPPLISLYVSTNYRGFENVLRICGNCGNKIEEKHIYLHWCEPNHHHSKK